MCCCLAQAADQWRIREYIRPPLEIRTGKIQFHKRWLALTSAGNDRLPVLHQAGFVVSITDDANAHMAASLERSNSLVGCAPVTRILGRNAEGIDQVWDQARNTCAAECHLDLRRFVW